MISGPPQRSYGAPAPQRDTEPIFGRRDDEPAPAQREPEAESQEAIATTATVIENKDDPQAKNDLDMPAFLRRERRLFQ